MRLIPVYFRQLNLAILVFYPGKAFQFSPVAAPKRVIEVVANINAGAFGDRFDVGDIADPFILHGRAPDSIRVETS